MADVTGDRNGKQTLDRKRRLVYGLAQKGSISEIRVGGITVHSNMRNKLSVALAAGLLLVSRAALPHHGANLYDMNKAVALKGTVTKFVWGNPHNQIFFDVTDEKGEVTRWVASTEPPLVMLERGWTARSLNPGDQVTAYVYAAKNGAPVGNLQKIVLVNGKELTAYQGRGAGPEPPAR